MHHNKSMKQKYQKSIETKQNGPICAFFYDVKNQWHSNSEIIHLDASTGDKGIMTPDLKASYPLYG